MPKQGFGVYTHTKYCALAHFPIMNRPDRITADVDTGDVVLPNVPVVGSLSFADTIIGLGPGFALLIITQTLLPESLTIYSVVAAGFGFLIGALGLIAAPEHTSLGTYASRIMHYYRRPSEVRYRRKNEPEDDAIERPFFEMEGRVQELSYVKKIYPEDKAIELEDGTICGAIRVTAANLDAAEPDERARAVGNAQNFFDNILDFDIMMYMTTRGFDWDDATSHYAERAQQEEVKDHLVLDYYANHHRRWVRDNMGGMPIRHHYIIAPVDESEVYQGVGGEDTVTSGLVNLPIIGRFVKSASDSEDFKLTKKEMKLKQLSKLDQRLQTLQGQFIGQIGNEETKAERLTSAEYAALLKEYWEGEVVSQDQFDELVSSYPIIISEHDDVRSAKKNGEQK